MAFAANPSYLPCRLGQGRLGMPPKAPVDLEFLGSLELSDGVFSLGSELPVDGTSSTADHIEIQLPALELLG